MFLKLCMLITVICLSFVSISISANDVEQPEIEYKGWFSIDADIAGHGHFVYDNAFVSQVNTKLGTQLRHISKQQLGLAFESIDSQLQFYFYMKINEVVNNQFIVTIKLQYLDVNESTDGQQKSYKEQKITGQVGINNRYQFDYDESQLHLFLKINKPDQNMKMISLLGQ